MAYILVSNSSAVTTYSVRPNHESSPYLKVNSSYIDLDTQTTTGLRLEYNNNINKYTPAQPPGIVTTTVQTSSTSYGVTTGYSGVSSNSYGYSGSTSTITAYSGRSSSLVGYSGRSSYTTGYAGSTSKVTGYSGRTSGTSGYQGYSSKITAYGGTYTYTVGYQGWVSTSEGYYTSAEQPGNMSSVTTNTRSSGYYTSSVDKGNMSSTTAYTRASTSGYTGVSSRTSGYYTSSVNKGNLSSTSYITSAQTTGYSGYSTRSSTSVYSGYLTRASSYTDTTGVHVVSITDKQQSTLSSLGEWYVERTSKGSILSSSSSTSQIYTQSLYTNKSTRDVSKTSYSTSLLYTSSTGLHNMSVVDKTWYGVYDKNSLYHAKYTLWRESNILVSSTTNSFKREQHVTSNGYTASVGRSYTISGFKITLSQHYTGNAPGNWYVADELYYMRRWYGSSVPVYSYTYSTFYTAQLTVATSLKTIKSETQWWITEAGYWDLTEQKTRSSYYLTNSVVPGNMSSTTAYTCSSYFLTTVQYSGTIRSTTALTKQVTVGYSGLSSSKSTYYSSGVNVGALSSTTALTRSSTSKYSGYSSKESSWYSGYSSSRVDFYQTSKSLASNMSFTSYVTEGVPRISTTTNSALVSTVAITDTYYTTSLNYNGNLSSTSYLTSSKYTSSSAANAGMYSTSQLTGYTYTSSSKYNAGISYGTSLTASSYMSHTTTSQGMYSTTSLSGTYYTSGINSAGLSTTTGLTNYTNTSSSAYNPGISSSSLLTRSYYTSTAVYTPSLSNVTYLTMTSRSDYTYTTTTIITTP